MLRISVYKITLNYKTQNIIITPPEHHYCIDC